MQPRRPFSAGRCFSGLVLFLLALSPAFSQPAPKPASALVWDSDKKEHTAQPGDEQAKIIFALTNVSTDAVTVNSARTSCGCSIAKMPAQPWRLEAGTSGQIEVRMDLRGKSGTLSKSLSLDTTAGTKHATFTVTIPGADNAGSGFQVPAEGVTRNAATAAGVKTSAKAVAETAPMSDRLDNQRLAMVDRQIVFKGECAQCHADTAKGKTGRDLFVAVCAICHDTPHRATMVPDLATLNKPTDTRYWRTWITYGREGSLMPAFAQSHGGPLTEEQIATLVEYLVTKPLKRAAAEK